MGDLERTMISAMMMMGTGGAVAYQSAPLSTRIVNSANSPVAMTAITPGDIGTTKPLGVYDPLGLMTKNPEKYRRFQEMEIKHGRLAMADFLGIVTTGAGYKWAGY